MPKFNMKGLRRLFGRGEEEARGLAGLPVERDVTPNFIKKRAAQSYQRRAMTEVRSTPMSDSEANAAYVHNNEFNSGRIKNPWEAGEFKTTSTTRKPYGPHEGVKPVGPYGPHEGVKPMGPYGPHEAPKTGGGSANAGTNPTAKAVEHTEAQREAIANDFNKQWVEGGWGSRASMIGKGAVGTTQASLAKEGYDPTIMGFAKATGKSMIKGAVVGGAVGGTVNAVQGGDFWDGAKSGAWNGAMIWGGAQTIRRGVGADTVFRGQNNVWNSAKNMGGAFAKDGVSSSARTLINARQMAGMSAAVTKGAVK